MRDLLSPTAWLDDAIINEYFKRLCAASLKTPKMLNCTHWDANLFPLMRAHGTEILDDTEDIFSHDLLLVPIHLGAHWTLTAVNFRSKRLYYLDSFQNCNEIDIMVGELNQ